MRWQDSLGTPKEFKMEFFIIYLVGLIATIVIHVFWAGYDDNYHHHAVDLIVQGFFMSLIWPIAIPLFLIFKLAQYISRSRQ